MAVRIFFVLLIPLFLFFGCYDFNNPVDPGAEDYQGYRSDPAGAGSVPSPPALLEVIPSPLNPEHGARLTWSDNSDNELGFVIERRQPAGIFGEIGSSPAAVDTTTLDDVSLIGETTYLYRVAAYNAEGTSAYSAEFDVTTAPNAPSSLNAVPAAGQVTLSWSDNSNAETGFVLDRSPDGLSWAGLVGAGVLGTDTTTYQNTGLDPGTYYYRVRAYNTNGASTYSNTVTASVPNVAIAP